MITARSRRRIGLTGIVALTLIAPTLLELSSGPSEASTSAKYLRGVLSHSTAVSITLPEGTSSLILRGKAPALVWPKAGQAAVAVGGVGVVGSSPGEQSEPIASLTKMMTALVILHDHPLVPGQPGPLFSITNDDVTTYKDDIADGDSTLRVVAGEQLSEYQLLEGLLIPSGDNIASLLAAWDAGSSAAFVDKMNAMTSTLGLTATHYGDPSGLSTSSRSTAADQALVAAQAMANPVIAAIVSHPQLAFPVTGTITNYNPALGVDGIVGIKSGWTFEAKSCLVTAAYRSVNHQQNVLIVSVALGQPGGLVNPAHVDEALLTATTAALSTYQIVASDATVASLLVRGSNSSRPLLGPKRSKVSTLWHGLRLEEKIVRTIGLSPRALATAVAGTVVATLQIRAPWGVVEQVPLHIASAPISTTTTTVPNSTTTAT